MANQTPPQAKINLKSLQQQGTQSLARLMLPLYRAFNAMAQEKYAQRGHAGLTTAHTLLFGNLDEEGTRIVSLAERMGTTKQFTGRLVHQLEEHGYIRTTPDPSDRRATIVTATPEGLHFFADACAVKDEIEGQFKAIAGEENIALLFTTLEKLASAFSAYESVGSAHPLGDDSEGT
ncbi:MAG TPA: MarR family transcriptional regulator [Aggregatilineales bacterium]|nr:MarR family transcriptional regulator [Aggregatilineales bacterium]